MALHPREAPISASPVQLMALLIPFMESVYPGISCIPVYCEAGLGLPSVAAHHADENNFF